MNLQQVSLVGGFGSLVSVTSGGAPCFNVADSWNGPIFWDRSLLAEIFYSTLSLTFSRRPFNCLKVSVKVRLLSRVIKSFGKVCALTEMK